MRDDVDVGSGDTRTILGWRLSPVDRLKLRDPAVTRMTLPARNQQAGSASPINSKEYKP
jgi:hypothetical protein